MPTSERVLKMKEIIKDNFNFKKAWAELKVDFTKANLRRTLINHLLIVLGAFLLALGDVFFLIPNEIVSGGATGLSVALGLILGVKPDVIILILHWVFFFIGFILLGYKFTFKTLLSTVVYSVAIILFSYFYDKLEWLHLSVETPTTDVGLLILAGAFGGALLGAGVGITFVGGGSTGGTDALTLAIEKYLHVKAATASFIVDCIIICMGFIYLKDMPKFLIGITTTMMCSVVINKVYLGPNNCFYAQIISSKWEAINDAINQKIGRGTTLFTSYGGYTGKEKMMIQVAFSKEEYDDIQKIIYLIDKNAFVTITHAHDIKGYGFKKVSKRLNREIKFEKYQAMKAIEDKKKKTNKTKTNNKTQVNKDSTETTESVNEEK